MNVAYQGPLKDYSGYGEANRHAVAALDAAGVNVCAKLVRYTSEPSDFGEMGKVVDRLIRNDDYYKIKIMHTTPDEFARLREPGKYHIAHFFWETDKIPKVFADGFSNVDEIWTGSQANVDAIKSMGVDKPVYIFPQATQTDRDWPPAYELAGLPTDGFLFYSIFEWTDRKNPKALLDAYLSEFQNNEPVGLLLKTYFRNFTLQNKRLIRDKIAIIKSQLSLKSYPQIFLYLDLMDRDQLMRIHSTGDCYVSAHRGEGWGVPQVEAMLAGNPVISTNYGGVHEFLKNDDTAKLLSNKMIPLRGMDHSQHFYTPDQKWAEVDQKELRKAMRWAYENRDEAAQMGARGSKSAVEQFNFETVGKMMADRLKEIEASL